MNIPLKTPEHQAVYEKLRDMILRGRFCPGEPLTITGLTTLLGAGMTPVREALRRLTAEDALQSLGNRRVVVPLLTRPEIDDIYFLRLAVETELAARAAKNIEKQHVSVISDIDQEIDLAMSRGDIEAYLERNFAFHFAIYAFADAPVLYRLAQSLWVRVGPSLRIVCGRYGTANLPDKHSDLLEALLSNDGERAARAMREDLLQGLLLSGDYSTPNP